MSATAIGLLAPVPEEHLISGLKTCVSQGRVAFGSRAWHVFRDLDTERQGQPVDAFIYASGSAKLGPPKVRWHARYVGHVEAKGGGHPEGMTYRPETTEKYETDNAGHWAVFWEIVDLRQLGKEEAIPMNLFRGWGTRKYYVSSFFPEGPLLVETP